MITDVGLLVLFENTYRRRRAMETGRRPLLGNVKVVGGFFALCMITTVSAAPIHSEQQILSHFRPSMDSIRLTKVANILADMRAVIGGRVLERTENASDDLVATSSSSSNLTFFDVPYYNNESRTWRTPSERYLFEGDILLSVNQASRILDWTSQKKPPPQAHKRAALIAMNHMLWEVMPIHYVFHDSLFDSQIPAIREALAYWQSHTCVSFSEISQPSPDMEKDVVIFYRGDGCYSMVGRAGGSQGISVGAQCTKVTTMEPNIFFKAGLIAHEVGHALGLWHEQSRPDSSCCIKILDENIQKGFHVNFRQRPSQESMTYGLPYDLGSVMHYRSNAFSKDDRIHTIETLEPGYQRTIGQRVAPSFIDVQAINKAYCSNRCRQELSCFYGGYTHPSLCNSCLCPDGLGGTNCEREAPSINANCGGVITVNDRWTEIVSPNFPQNYGFNQRCNWLIKAQPGFRVQLEFEYFDVSCNTVTCFDYVELKLDSREFSKTGMRYCCNDAPQSVVYSAVNDMIVIFNSESHSRGGFKVRVAQYPARKA